MFLALLFSLAGKGRRAYPPQVLPGQSRLGNRRRVPVLEGECLLVVNVPVAGDGSFHSPAAPLAEERRLHSAARSFLSIVSTKKMPGTAK